VRASLSISNALIFWCLCASDLVVDRHGYGWSMPTGIAGHSEEGAFTGILGGLIGVKVCSVTPRQSDRHRSDMSGDVATSG